MYLVWRPCVGLYAQFYFLLVLVLEVVSRLRDWIASQPDIVSALRLHLDQVGHHF